MSATLLSMNKEEAVVAENVTTYKRIDVEAELPKLELQVKKDSALIPKIEAQLTEVKLRYEAAAYKLELYQALKEAFDKDYPIVAQTSVTGEFEGPLSPPEKADSEEDVGEENEPL